MSPYIAFYAYGIASLGGPASFFFSLTSSLSLSGFKYLEMSWDSFLRYGVVFFSSFSKDSFLFFFSFVNQNWNSILLNRFPSCFFRFPFVFFLFSFDQDTRQTSIIFSFFLKRKKKYNCLCRCCWFSSSFDFLVIPFTTVKKWKRRKEISVECARKIKAQAENDDKTQALHQSIQCSSIVRQIISGQWRLNKLD